MKKKLLSTILALVMLLALVPAAVFAAPYNTKAQAEGVYDYTYLFNHIDVRVLGDMTITTMTDGVETDSVTKNVAIVYPVTVTINHADGSSISHTFYNATMYEWRWDVFVAKSDSITISGRLQVQGEYTTHPFSKTYQGRDDFVQAILDCDGLMGLDFIIKAEELIEIVTPKGELTINKSNDGAMPESVEFSVTGPNDYSETVVLSERNDWTVTLDQLVYGDYTVTETTKNTPDGYDCTTTVDDETADSAVVTISDSNKSAVVSFVNSYVEQTAQVNLSKRAETDTAYIVDFPAPAVTIQNEAGETVWSGNLAANSDNGASVALTAGTYTVTETGYDVEGYDCDMTLYVNGNAVRGNSFEVSQADLKSAVNVELVNSYSYERSDSLLVNFEKVWKDTDAANRPDSISVEIYNGEELYKTVELTAENEWKTEIELPLYDEQGAMMAYNVSEVAVDGYTTDYKAEALSYEMVPYFTYEDEAAPADANVIVVAVEDGYAVWSSEELTKDEQTAVMDALYATGAPKDEAFTFVSGDEALKELGIVEEDGMLVGSDNEIVLYMYAIPQSALLTVTNTEVTKPVDPTPDTPDTPDTKPDDATKPETGDHTFIGLYAVLAVMAAAGIAVVAYVPSTKKHGKRSA